MAIKTHSILTLHVQHSERLAGWLNHPASLTDKLHHSTGDARIELMEQKWVPTDWWSTHVLQIQDKLVFTREIIMKSNDIPCWYARSIIPQKCYELDPSFFDRLNNESIKNLIFGESKVQRIEGMNYPINHQCIEYQWVKNTLDLLAEILWVRLTECCFLQRHSFYLVEVLLPGLERVSL